jgi:predicted GIY-YIG superfamily endonuclease
MAYYVYILECADGSYYTGSASDLDRRVMEHQQGITASSYTFRRRPVNLAWSEEVATYNEALLHEHQIKGWSRAKKEALIRGNLREIHEIVKQERRRREHGKRPPSP